MELRTRPQRKALAFFKDGTKYRRGSGGYTAGIEAVMSASRPMALARSLLKAEGRGEIARSRKLVSREVLDLEILKLTARYGPPEPALSGVGVSSPVGTWEAPILRARRLADAGKLTTTQLNELLSLMVKCSGLLADADVKAAKEKAARKLKPVDDPRYRLSPDGYSIPLQSLSLDSNGDITMGTIKTGRFSGLLTIRCPDALPEAIAEAAGSQFTTSSEYTRRALLTQLRADGVDLSKHKTASAAA